MEEERFYEFRVIIRQPSRKASVGRPRNIRYNKVHYISRRSGVEIFEGTGALEAT